MTQVTCLQVAGIWDPTVALISHNSGIPDSSAVSATATATVTGATSSALSGTGTPASTSSKSSTNAGAIAGGVVGGVVGLALIGLGVFFLLRRRRAAAGAASAQFAGNTEKWGLTGPSPGFQTPALPMQTEPMKLYVRDETLHRKTRSSWLLTCTSYRTPPILPRSPLRPRLRRLGILPRPAQSLPLHTVKILHRTVTSLDL
jgi:hypothetical protein